MRPSVVISAERFVFPDDDDMTKAIFSFAATALAAAIAAPASAQTQTAYMTDPISIEAFSANADFSPPTSQWFDGMNVSGTSSDVTISFVNTAGIPAKSVEFAVRSGKHTC